jgi:DNA-binding NtrC family response regulator
MTTAVKEKQALGIMVVDDEAIVRESLGSWFREDGHRVETARDAREALHMLAKNHYDIALVDIKMPGVDGLELQGRMTEVQPELTVIIMTAYASVESAVKALKAGAYDYITKPFDPDELSHLIRRAAEHRSLRAENLRLKESLEEVTSATPIIGQSAATERVLQMIETVSATDATVLVQGESGTGKELVARAIHASSERRYNPMVVVNCGALAEGILESELFGHEPGAFTGARYRRKGKFEAADGGTIFLDEIGDVTPRVQVELLRVLEEKSVTRLGGNTPIPVDFRVVAATNRDLEAMVRDGKFRDELFWRLNVFKIEIPPLRNRREDIPLLADHFLERFCRAMNRREKGLADDARVALQNYTWPGNVRELQNAIERSVVIGTSDTIGVKDLPVRITGAPQQPGPQSMSEVEKIHIQAVLDSTGGNISRAARILEVDRVTLYNKIRKYDLKRPSHGNAGDAAAD